MSSANVEGDNTLAKVEHEPRSSSKESFTSGSCWSMLRNWTRREGRNPETIWDRCATAPVRSSMRTIFKPARTRTAASSRSSPAPAWMRTPPWLPPAMRWPITLSALRASSAQRRGRDVPRNCLRRRENCDPAYPDVCIPPPPPGLDCKDIPYRKLPRPPAGSSSLRRERQWDRLRGL